MMYFSQRKGGRVHHKGSERKFGVVIRGVPKTIVTEVLKSPKVIV